jgi:hypothetical protein
VNFAKAYLLAAVLAAAPLQAQVASAPVVQIRVSSSLKTCFIADLGVSCSDVGATLQGMKVPVNSDIHIVGDRDVTYELLHATLESLSRSGYSMKVGFMTH